MVNVLEMKTINLLPSGFKILNKSLLQFKPQIHQTQGYKIKLNSTVEILKIKHFRMIIDFKMDFI